MTRRPHIVLAGESSPVIMAMTRPGERYGARGTMVNESDEPLLSFFDAPEGECLAGEPEGRVAVRMTAGEAAIVPDGPLILWDGFPPMTLTADSVRLARDVAARIATADDGGPEP